MESLLEQQVDGGLRPSGTAWFDVALIHKDLRLAVRELDMDEARARVAAATAGWRWRARPVPPTW